MDCTGHGVPGAIMSIIGYTLLRNIIRHPSHTPTPAEVLNTMNEELFKILNKESTGHLSNDGMDIALLRLDKNTMNALFSGANLSLYHLRPGHPIQIIPGSKHGIGRHSYLEKFVFTELQLNLQKNDMLYLASDGYSDQFGGTHGKKIMKSRLKEIFDRLSAMPCAEQYEEIRSFFYNWKKDFDQVDDVTLLGVRI